MCLPALAIAGIAASLAGAGLSYIGQRKAESAMNHTFNRERSRQKAFEADQVSKFEDSLASTKAVQDPAEAAKAASAREALFNSVSKSASPAAAGYLPGSSSAPAVVGEAAAKAGAESDAQTSQLATSLARLGGLTDALQKNDIQIGRNSQEIAQIGGFKRGSLDVLNAEMQAAQQKGRTLRTLGTLAQAFGSAMSLGAGGFGGAGAVAHAAAPVGAATTSGVSAASNAAKAFLGAI